MDKDTKSFNLSPIFPCKLSWDFCKKCNCDSIISQWKISFQVSDLKGRNFLELLDDDSNPLELSASKGDPWLQYFGHSNSLCTRATRAIVNHAPISKYWLRFFPREEFACPYSSYPIESRQHILHECKRFDNYWNPRRDSITHFTLFLKYNSNAFSEGEGNVVSTRISLFSFVVFSSFSLSFSFSFPPFSLLLYFSFSHVVLVSMYVVTK